MAGGRKTYYETSCPKCGYRNKCNIGQKKVKCQKLSCDCVKVLRK